jgi:hypothetical protein
VVAMPTHMVMSGFKPARSHNPLAGGERRTSIDGLLSKKRASFRLPNSSPWPYVIFLSSVNTVNSVRVAMPKAVLMAASVASRPRATKMRPMRG